VRTAAYDTLAAALDIGRRELVAMVGGGGKTGALRLLAGELAAAGSKVIATTTTAMHLRELSAVGPVVWDSGDRPLADGVEAALTEWGAAGVAAAPGAEGKVVGLSPEAVDALWTGDIGAVADYVIVEADGSRGKPLKAFGPGEPRVPSATTIVVQVAGLDAIGMPLDEEHVHRAELAAAALGVPLGSTVTVGLFAECLREQTRFLAKYCGSARIVTMLNKAEGAEREASGLQVASDLLASAGGRRDHARPDAAVVGSLRERRFTRVWRGKGLVTAIVLAAGLSTRMGGQKVLLPLKGRPLVQWVVDAALGSQAARTVVVVGHEAGPVIQALEGRPLTVVPNPDHAQGMSTSLRAGVQAAGECEAVVFLLGDQPFVTSGLVDLLIEAFRETGSAVVRPLVGGQPANPVLMSAALFPEILAQSGDVGGREIVDRHPGEVCLVPVDDRRAILDIDVLTDYAAAAEEICE